MEITHSCVTTLLTLFVVSIVSIGEGGIADMYSLSPIIEVDSIGKINKKYRTTMSSMSAWLRLIRQWTGWDSRPVVRLKFQGNTNLKPRDHRLTADAQLIRLLVYLGKISLNINTC